MSRTYRKTPFKHYWGSTKTEAKKRWEEEINNPCNPDYVWGETWVRWLERDYLLHGTDAKNHSYSTHEYFNRAHRVGRRIAREQLRLNVVVIEDYDFDDSEAVAKYKGVWWDIY